MNWALSLKFISKVLLTGFVAVILSLSTFNDVAKLEAQTLSTPVADDPELYILILHFVHKMNSESARQGTDQKIFMERALCREFSISPADLAVISRLAETAELSFWTNDRKKSSDLNTRHSNANQMISQMSASLSADGWTNFHKFLNGPYREKVVVIRGGTSK